MAIVVQSIKDSEPYKLSKLALEDPLTPHTETKRRKLLFTACFSILLVVFNLKVLEIPWVTFKNTEDTLPILQGTLAAALLYIFFAFAFHALTDLTRWHFNAESIYLDSHFRLLHDVEKNVNTLTHWLDTPPPDNQARQAQIQDSVSNVVVYLSSLGAAVSTIKSAHLQLSITTWIRIVLLDLGLPLFLGIFAMFKIGPALIPFLAVVFG